MIRREESCGSSFFLWGIYCLAGRAVPRGLGQILDKRSEIDQKGKRGEQPRGGLDKFWSKEVKLTKKGRGESSPEGAWTNFGQKK